jgi:hypothetical protein
MKFSASLLALAFATGILGFACPLGEIGDCCLNFDGPNGQGEYCEGLNPFPSLFDS